MNRYIRNGLAVLLVAGLPVATNLYANHKMKKDLREIEQIQGVELARPVAKAYLNRIDNPLEYAFFTYGEKLAARDYLKSMGDKR